MAQNNADGSKFIFKFLFRAELQDGTIIQQDQDDQSRLDAKRSCFFDVMQQVEKGNHIVRFVLEGDGHTYVVDLRDGHFEIDGIPFVMHEREMENFRVMYFRVRDTHMSIGYVVKAEECGYRIGWQANDKHTGENVQHYIEIR